MSLSSLKDPERAEDLIKFRAISGYIVNYQHILLANP